MIDDTVTVSVDGRDKYRAKIGLQRFRKTIQIQDEIKTEKDQVKEMIEMLEAQRKSKVSDLQDEGIGNE